MGRLANRAEWGRARSEHSVGTRWSWTWTSGGGTRSTWSPTFLSSKRWEDTSCKVMNAGAKITMNNCFHWRALHNDFSWQAQLSNVCSDVCVSLEWAAPADTCLSLVCHLFVTFPSLLLPNAWDASVLWIGMPSMPKPMPCGNAYYSRHDNNVSYPPGHVMGLVYRLQLIISPKMDQDEYR